MDEFLRFWVTNVVEPYAGGDRCYKCQGTGVMHVRRRVTWKDVVCAVCEGWGWLR